MLQCTDALPNWDPHQFVWGNTTILSLNQWVCTHKCPTCRLLHVWQRVRGRALEEVVILNVDSNTLETPFDDLKRIPSDVVINAYLIKQFSLSGNVSNCFDQSNCLQQVIKMCFQVSGLKLCLKRQAVSPGCGVSRAFLKAQALLFGGYRDALQCQQVIGLCSEFQITHVSVKIIPDTVLWFLFRMVKCYSTRRCF